MTLAKKSLIAVPLLLMIACTPSQVTTALRNAITAAQVAITLIGSQTHLKPEVVAAVKLYLGQANTALGTVTEILQKNESPAATAADITAALAAVVHPDLPAGTPQEVASVVQAVAVAIRDLLAQFPSAHSRVAAAPVKLTRTDHAELKKAASVIDENREKLARIR